MSENNEFMDDYLDLMASEPGDYREICIHGVREILDDVLSERIGCAIDDGNPEFYSVYVRHRDGCSEVIADASLGKLDGLRAYASQLAAKHGCGYQDYTLDPAGVAISGDGIAKGYHVHIYAIVRVKVCDVEAGNPKEAIKKAEATLDLHALFGDGENQEFAEDIDCFCVDEAGDEGFLNTRWYQKDGVTRLYDD